MAPDVVRVMLTGYLHQSTAVEAINQGCIFRFLNKPCPTEKLVQTLEEAVAHHNLIIAERDLLENTLGGSLKVLSEILAMSEPEIFGQAEALRDAIRHLAASLDITKTWDLEAAALLSQIGSVTLPPEIILKSRLGHELSAGEQEVFNHIPAVGSSLLGPIPAPGRRGPHHPLPEQELRRQRISGGRSGGRSDPHRSAPAENSC